MTSTHLEALLPELKRQLFFYLDAQTALALACTCRTLQQAVLAHDNDSFWQQHYAAAYPTQANPVTADAQLALLLRGAGTAVNSPLFARLRLERLEERWRQSPTRQSCRLPEDAFDPYGCERSRILTSVSYTVVRGRRSLYARRVNQDGWTRLCLPRKNPVHGNDNIWPQRWYMGPVLLCGATAMAICIWNPEQVFRFVWHLDGGSDGMDQHDDCNWTHEWASTVGGVGVCNEPGEGEQANATHRYPSAVYNFNRCILAGYYLIVAEQSTDCDAVTAVQIRDLRCDETAAWPPDGSAAPRRRSWPTRPDAGVFGDYVGKDRYTTPVLEQANLVQDGRYAQITRVNLLVDEGAPDEVFTTLVPLGGCYDTVSLLTRGTGRVGVLLCQPDEDDSAEVRALVGFSLVTGQAMWRYASVAADANLVAFPAQQYLAISFATSTVRLISLRDGTLLKTFSFVSADGRVPQSISIIRIARRLLVVDSLPAQSKLTVATNATLLDLETGNALWQRAFPSIHSFVGNSYVAATLNRFVLVDADAREVVELHFGPLPKA
ncbi:hypothetical protein THASP1DRAFT_33255 [Thamnocephalis sphaerospora]|uniref:F-box domain-containing protein n=1 Tax=Thamnocephalis sphaerospora TaxID=78915 RepID=A0A4P9XGZ4_9FUNG|nr:hypothetical protein THASP1DRAFT_33255 [Thamnocephalis sphaerospora]|eukprot:RKP04924.1 hypothetical protein THASP1DRAFT_33255 [Thamnocephalis sphaerospora]